VRWRYSCLQKSRTPVSSLNEMDSVHGVRAIAPFRRRRAATTSDKETPEVELEFMGWIGTNKKPRVSAQGFRTRCASDLRALSLPRVGANNDRYDHHRMCRDAAHVRQIRCLTNRYLSSVPQNFVEHLRRIGDLLGSQWFHPEFAMTIKKWSAREFLGRKTGISRDKMKIAAQYPIFHRPR
jgi:hypothetical protein